MSPRLSLGLAVLWIVVFGALASSYGPTWDACTGELPFGERILAYVETGDAAYIDFESSSSESRIPPARAPHPDFRVGFQWWQIHPCAGLVSALCCRVLWTGLGVVPALTSHHLAIALFIAVWMVVQLHFLGARIGTGAAILGVLLALLSPRFFADAFNNPKDVPESCLYVVASFAGFRALHGSARSTWILFGALVGLALAQKPNALFLPVQLGAYAVLALLLGLWDSKARLPAVLTGIAIATVVSLGTWYLVWVPMWSDPIGGAQLWIAEVLRIGRVEGNPISLHGVGHVLATTPLPVLALAPIGLAATFVEPRLRLFLAIGALVPVGRTLLPGARDFDGVRHFLEFYPPLCALAGAGAFQLARWILRSSAKPGLSAALAALALVPGAMATARTHPNGICYFNALVGGLDGARARGIPDACDYWGNSYWQGLAWVNEHAEAGAGVMAPLAAHVVRAAAPVKLRKDLALASSTATPLYVMYVVREAFYGPFVRVLDREREPVHEIRVDGAPILRIQRIRADDQPRFMELFERQSRAARSLLALQERIAAEPSRASELSKVLAERAVVGEAETLARFRALLPEGLAAEAEDTLWLLADPIARTIFESGLRETASTPGP
jgi:hypothetical protein